MTSAGCGVTVMPNSATKTDLRKAMSVAHLLEYLGSSLGIKDLANPVVSSSRVAKDAASLATNIAHIERTC
jgi:hypothetical protein